MSITFLIPVYNEVKTVKRAIEETINLNIPDKEIIIIDNGSTDKTPEIINEYQHHQDIKIILQEKNLGFGNSIREGFMQSSKKFVYLQFGDLEYIRLIFGMIFGTLARGILCSPQRVQTSGYCAEEVLQFII